MEVVSIARHTLPATRPRSPAGACSRRAGFGNTSPGPGRHRHADDKMPLPDGTNGDRSPGCGKSVMQRGLKQPHDRAEGRSSAHHGGLMPNGKGGRKLFKEVDYEQLRNDGMQFISAEHGQLSPCLVRPPSRLPCVRRTPCATRRRCVARSPDHPSVHSGGSFCRNLTSRKAATVTRTRTTELLPVAC